MRIGKLARQTGTSVATIRYYEREQLLPAPRRSAANYRIYDQQHLERLQFIRQCRSLDMTLAEIRALLATRDNPASSCHSANQVVDTHITHIETRIRELQHLAEQLHQLRAQCDHDSPAAECGILQSLTHSD